MPIATRLRCLAASSSRSTSLKVGGTMVRLRAPLSISLAATALLAFAAGAQPYALSTEFLRITTADGVETAGLLYAPLRRAPPPGVVPAHAPPPNFSPHTTT